MPVLPPRIDTLYDSKINGFTRRFPNEAARFEAAEQLVLGHDVDVPHQSQLAIATHWAEGDDATRTAVARHIYDLGDMADTFPGEPVVVLNEGSVEDILSNRRYLAGDISGSIGIVPTDANIGLRGIFHGFSGRLGGNAKPGIPFAPPYVVTESSIQVVDDSAFMFEGDEFVSAVKPIPRLRDDLPFMLPGAYRAEIPLNRDVYMGRFTASFVTVVFGLEHVQQLDAALVGKGFSSILEPVKDMVRPPKPAVAKKQEKARRKELVSAAEAKADSKAAAEAPTPKKARFLPAALRKL